MKILRYFERGNTDGVGSAYVKDNRFIIDKYPKSLSSITRQGHPFLGHMPYNGWTIAHLRAASHGGNCHENTHPFQLDNWAFIHNGIWSDYRIAKLALSKTVKFQGETDSEVAAHLMRIIGPRKFAKEIDHSGVFLALHRSGSLHVMKTSGDLCLTEGDDKKILMASELSPRFYDSVEALQGWYYFNKEGEYVRHKENEYSYTAMWPSANIRSTEDKTVHKPVKQTYYYSHGFHD